MASTFEYRPQIEHDRTKIFEDDFGNLLTPSQESESEAINQYSIDEQARIQADLRLLQTLHGLDILNKQIYDLARLQLKYLKIKVDPKKRARLHDSIRRMLGAQGKYISGNAPIEIDINLYEDALNITSTMTTGYPFGGSIDNNVLAGLNSEEMKEKFDAWQLSIVWQMVQMVFFKLGSRLGYWIGDQLEMILWIPGIKELQKLIYTGAKVLEEKQFSFNTNSIIEPFTRPDIEAVKDANGKVVDVNTPNMEDPYGGIEIGKTEMPENAEEMAANAQIRYRRGIPGYGTSTPPQGGISLNMVDGANGIKGEVGTWATGVPESGEPTNRVAVYALQYTRNNQQKLDNLYDITATLIHPKAYKMNSENLGAEPDPGVQGPPHNQYEDYDVSGNKIAELRKKDIEESKRTIGNILKPGWEPTAKPLVTEFKDDLQQVLDLETSLMMQMLNVLYEWARDPQTLCCLIQWLKDWLLASGKADMGDINKLKAGLATIMMYLSMIKQVIFLTQVRIAIDLNDISDMITDAIQELLTSIVKWIFMSLRCTLTEKLDEIESKCMAFLAQEDIRCMPAKQFFEVLHTAIDSNMALFTSILAGIIKRLRFGTGKIKPMIKEMQSQTWLAQFSFILDNLFDILSALENCVQEDQVDSITNTFNVTNRDRDISDSLDIVERLRDDRRRQLGKVVETTASLQDEYDALYALGVGSDGKPLKTVPAMFKECKDAPTGNDMLGLLERFGVHLNKPGI